MKHWRWRAGILVIWFVSLSSILPRVDSPETAYDETDSPINLTSPVEVLTIVVMPITHFAVISKEQRVWSEPSATTNMTPNPGISISHFVLTPLCILLC